MNFLLFTFGLLHVTKSSDSGLIELEDATDNNYRRVYKDSDTYPASGSYRAHIRDGRELHCDGPCDASRPITEKQDDTPTDYSWMNHEPFACVYTRASNIYW